MISLRDIRDYIATLGIAEDENCYMGILPDKQLESIGTYPLRRNGRTETVGGNDNRSYEAKSASFLVHWNKSPSETEKAAHELFCALEKTKMETVNGHLIKFVMLNSDEPVWVGNDKKGIYEYVIECVFYFERKEDEE